jgi:N-formylglutamate deformylase
MTQRFYMQETMPFDYLPETAAQVQPTLRAVLAAVLGLVELSGR